MSSEIRNFSPIDKAMEVIINYNSKSITQSKITSSIEL
jgi:hypothetical protein